jgi:hypothetical protein
MQDRCDVADCLFKTDEIFSERGKNVVCAKLEIRRKY